ncbi:hypothetical protein C1N55_01470 [Lysinibacillus sp. SGAir0095]|nr:hypothetical protein C1N55_01470 [Lysinibacillus sp. SGAir0095]
MVKGNSRLLLIGLPLFVAYPPISLIFPPTFSEYPPLLLIFPPTFAEYPPLVPFPQKETQKPKPTSWFGLILFTEWQSHQLQFA